MVWFIYFAILLVFMYGYRKLFNISKYKLPPGPPTLPIIGSLLHVIFADAKKPAIAFKKLGEKYGPIFTLQMGSMRAVVVNSFKTIQQYIATSDDYLAHNFSDEIWFVEKSKSRTIGLLFAMPQYWRENRMYVHKLLRKHGFSTKTTLEKIILEEILELCDEIKAKMVDGEVVLHVTKLFNITFYNIIWTIITGKKYGRTDANSINMINSVDRYVKSGQQGGGITALYPWLIKYIPRLCGFHDHKKTCATWRELIEKAVEERRSKGYYKDNPENFIDDFLQKISETSQTNNPFDTIYNVENLVATLQDLVLGGTDTQAHLLKFFLRWLVKHPQVQKNLQAEIDLEIGKENINTTDIPKLKYTQATLHEVIRLGNVAIIIPRAILKDIKLEGYDIPARTTIYCNMWTANQDPDVWINPEEFKPERFLTPDNELINTEKVYSFGFGKRRCIGEQLAKTSMMLAMTTLLQHFTFHEPPSGKISLEDIHGFTRDTVPFDILIKARK